MSGTVAASLIPDDVVVVVPGWFEIHFQCLPSATVTELRLLDQREQEPNLEGWTVGTWKRRSPHGIEGPEILRGR